MQSPQDKRGSSVAKEPQERPQPSPLQEVMEVCYQAVIDTMKTRARKVVQSELIRAACKKLRKYRLEELLIAIDGLPSRKKMEELEAKNNFLLIKAKMLQNGLNEQKTKLDSNG